MEKLIIGNAVMYHGDCLEVLPELLNDSIDIIWTDPPYGNNNNNGDLIARMDAALGRGTYTPGVDDRPIANDGPESMRRVVGGMLGHAARILKKESSCCCCCCGGGGGPLPLFAWLADRMDSGGLTFCQAVVWDKGGLGIGWRYRRNYEFVMVAHRKGGKLKWEYERSDAVTANVVRIGKIIPSAEDHPTPKPVALIEHFLRLHGKSGDVVLDPFMGHAPAGVAALGMGMKYIGIEIEKEHFDRACERIENAQRQQRLFG